MPRSLHPSLPRFASQPYFLSHPTVAGHSTCALLQVFESRGALQGGREVRTVLIFGAVQVPALVSDALDSSLYLVYALCGWDGRKARRGV